MAIIGMPQSSSRPAGRRGFGENPSVDSKGARNARHNDFKPSDPRQPSQPATIQRRDVGPSAPSRSHTERVPLSGITKQVGHATDGSGRYAHPDYEKTTNLHGSDGFHETRTDGASGQMHYASAEFGKPTQRPKAKKPAGTTKHDAGALAGDSGSRDSYTGGRGDVTPRKADKR